MKLSEAREAYYTASGTASTVARQAALAGIAIVWLFNSKIAQGFALPRELIVVVFVLVFTLLFDLLQYLTQAVIWGTFSRHYEKQEPLEDDPDFDASAYLNWPILLFFVGKFLLLLAGYILLARYLWNAIAAAKI